MSAHLIVVRDSPDDLGIRGLDILLDRKFVANIAYEGSFETEVTPGEHEILATNSLYKRKLLFTVQDGETARFRATNVIGMFGRLLLAVGCPVYSVRLERID